MTKINSIEKYADSIEPAIELLDLPTEIKRRIVITPLIIEHGKQENVTIRSENLRRRQASFNLVPTINKQGERVGPTNKQRKQVAPLARLEPVTLATNEHVHTYVGKTINDAGRNFRDIIEQENYEKKPKWEKEMIDARIKALANGDVELDEDRFVPRPELSTDYLKQIGINPVW